MGYCVGVVGPRWSFSNMSKATMHYIERGGTLVVGGYICQ